MREAGFPVAPMILGVVLGPILDNNLRRSLALTQGDPLPFVSRPISAVIASLVLVIVLLSLPPVRRRLAALQARFAGGAQ
jgi:putative tricarboxylic transport membrane protein